MRLLVAPCLLVQAAELSGGVQAEHTLCFVAPIALRINTSLRARIFQDVHKRRGLVASNYSWMTSAKFHTG